VIKPSLKNDRASLILRLLSVDKYLYVTKKFAELTIEALMAKKTPMRPMSVLPTAVYRVRAENGVTIAQPGSRSLVLRSIDQTNPSSPVKRRNNVFWFLAANNLQRQASLVNLSCLQFDSSLCCVELESNIL
jgi:hypothetical protein